MCIDDANDANNDQRWTEHDSIRLFGNISNGPTSNPAKIIDWIFYFEIKFFEDTLLHLNGLIAITQTVLRTINSLNLVWSWIFCFSKCDIYTQLIARNCLRSTLLLTPNVSLISDDHSAKLP